MRKVVAVQSGLNAVSRALEQQGYDVKSLYDVSFANQYVHAVVYNGPNPDNEKVQSASNFDYTADMNYREGHTSGTMYIDANGMAADEVVRSVKEAIGE